MSDFNYGLFFEHSKFINLICNSNFDVIDFNNEAATSFGFKKESSKKISILEITVDSDKDLLASKLEELKSNAKGSIKLALQSKQKGEHAAGISWEIHNFNNLFYFIGKDLVRDNLTNVYFKEIQDAGEIGYWRLDLKTNQALWSDKTYHIHEVEVGTVVDTSEAINFYAPEAREEIQECVSLAIENGTPWDVELPFITAKGNKLWVKAAGKAILKDGKTEELYGTFQDISRRKNSELKLKYLIDHAGDGFWDWDIENNREYMSPRFWQTLGYSPDEKTSNPEEWKKIIFEQDLKLKELNYKKHVETKGEHPFRLEVRFKHKDGSTVWIICNGKVVEWSEAGEPLRMIGTHTDVTKLKSAQTKITESYKLASLGTMAGGIAHEINNPLAIISTNTMLLKTILKSHSYAEKPEVFDSAIKNIEATIERISKIVRGMMQLVHRGDSEEHQVNDFKELIETICSFSVERFKSECVIHKLNIKGTGLVKCNVTQISQVITNILSNAVHAISKIEDKWISIEGHVSDEKAVLRICDSGKGISEEKLNKIFDPFFSSKKVGEGTGLGLSISKEIMKQHGGQVFYDKQSKNTCFVIELPIVKNCLV